MNITDALNKIATIQGQLTCTVDGVGSVNMSKAWPFPPTGLDGSVDVPCCINYWTYDRQHMSNGFREKFYTIRMELLIAEKGSDTPAQAQLAAALHEALLDAFGQAVVLNEGWALQDIVGDGNGETTGFIPFNEKQYVGLTYSMPLQLQDVFEPFP